jgi:hypothetical protein
MQHTALFVLGLKGTMSEAELHVLKARLRGGILNKVRRGEYRCPLPTGFVYDEVGNVVLDPDAQIRDTIAHFFETFSRGRLGMPDCEGLSEGGPGFSVPPHWGTHGVAALDRFHRYARLGFEESTTMNPTSLIFDRTIVTSAVLYLSVRRRRTLSPPRKTSSLNSHQST